VPAALRHTLACGVKLELHHTPPPSEQARVLISEVPGLDMGETVILKRLETVVHNGFGDTLREYQLITAREKTYRVTRDIEEPEPFEVGTYLVLPNFGNLLLSTYYPGFLMTNGLKFTGTLLVDEDRWKFGLHIDVEQAKVLERQGEFPVSVTVEAQEALPELSFTGRGRFRWDRVEPSIVGSTLKP
jgi:hypothetical protein